MAIRLEALRAAVNRNGRIWRVRRRGYDIPRQWDTDGAEAVPETWRRFESEYFSRLVYALRAAEPGAGSGDWGRQGYVDQQKADAVLALYQREFGALPEYTDGRLTVLRVIQVENARIAHGY